MDEQRADPVVLLVDDDEMERFLHRQALEPAGFEIVEAEDGATALQAFAITVPDIVVLDVMMPEMDGFAVCQAIRAMPAGRNTPILMATGLDDVESIKRAYRVGATDLLLSRLAARCCRTGSDTCSGPITLPRPRELPVSETFAGCQKVPGSNAHRKCRACSASTATPVCILREVYFGMYVLRTVQR
jgi:CheY-like chemotaxis protein